MVDLHGWQGVQRAAARPLPSPGRQSVVCTWMRAARPRSARRPCPAGRCRTQSASCASNAGSSPASTAMTWKSGCTGSQGSGQCLGLLWTTRVAQRRCPHKQMCGVLGTHDLCRRGGATSNNDVQFSTPPGEKARKRNHPSGTCPEPSGTRLKPAPGPARNLHQHLPKAPCCWGVAATRHIG